MGSKRAMLGNGLGHALGRSLREAERVLDLFTGSAAVAWYVAEQHGKEVLASDLQRYSAVLAASVIERTTRITDRDWVESWMDRARSRVLAHKHWHILKEIQASLGNVPVSEVALR